MQKNTALREGTVAMFLFLLAVLMKAQFLCDVTPYILVNTYHVSEKLAACVFVIKEDVTASSSDTSVTLIIDTASWPTRLVYKLWTESTCLIVPCVLLTRDDSGLTGQLIMPLIIQK